MFGDHKTVLMKHGQLLIVDSIEVSAKVKEERLKRRSRIAQDVMSLAGGGFTENFCNSGTSNGPAGCKKWSYCHTNETNFETTDDIADLNNLERYCSNFLHGNDLIRTIALLSNQKRYVFLK